MANASSSNRGERDASHESGGGSGSAARQGKIAEASSSNQAQGAGDHERGEGNAQASYTLLPLYIIEWIMREGLPNNFSIAQDAKDKMQKCASKFIRFVSSERRNGRRSRVTMCCWRWRN